MNTNSIERFINAQKNDHNDFEEALLEVKQGYKRSHWMWYIFPQIHGLGKSQTAKYYEINNIDEVRDYLKNEYLYNNLVTICEELLKLETNDPIEIFGEIDAMKLKSSMTLFEYISDLDKNRISIFSDVLNKYYNGERDIRTIDIIQDDIFNF